MPNRLYTFFKGTLLFIFLVAVTFGVVKRQELTDWWYLRNYTPPAEIARLADDVLMSPKSRDLFYVYRPSLQSKASFRDYCPSLEQSIVLGCYVSRKGLYVLDVTDERLQGVEQVTAAHEMLHVAYERLSSSERTRINNLLRAEELIITDERVKQTLASYRVSSMPQIENEMHSIFATEITTLSPELESYYGRYFSDRTKVVGYASAYAAVFVERESRIAELDAALELKKREIDNLKMQLDNQGASLSSDRAELESLRQSNTEAYNERVDDYNAATRVYNQTLDRLRARINAYNLQVEERNSIALEEKELINAIDTRAKAL